LWQGVHAAQDQRNQDGWNFAQAGFNILAFYLLVTCPWFQQWYTVWLLALAPLVASGNSVLLAVIFGFTALGKQLVAGPLLFWPRPKLPQPGLEIRLTLIVMSLVWAYALYWLAAGMRRLSRPEKRR
jgi:hypothetical protein